MNNIFLVTSRIFSNRIFTYCLLGVLVFITFFPSLFCGFTNFDDDWMLTQNYLVRKLNFEHITENIFGKIYKGVYQPLVFLTYALEYYFFRYNPFPYHFDNVILQVLNTLLVFIFINQLCGNKKVALITSLFWSLNPLKAESVTWVTERKDLIYAFFYLLSLIYYIRYIKTDHKKIYFAISLLFFLLSCLSKLTAVSLSFIIVLLDYYFNRKFSIKMIGEKVIFFSISLIVGIFSIWVLKQDIEGVTTYNFSAFERAQLVSSSFILYLAKSYVPFNLSVFHPYQYPPGSLPVGYIIYLLFSVIIIFYFISLFLKDKNRKITFGILFFISALIFALQIFPVGDAAFADRNIYISSIGTSYLAGELFRYCINKFSAKITVICTVLILSIYSVLTFQRTKIWQDSISLYSDVLEKYPNSHLSYLNRGIAKSNLRDYKGALDDYNAAIQKNPDYLKTYLNRALVFVHLHDSDKALRDYNFILKIAPDYGKAYLARGWLYRERKNYNLALHDYTNAITVLQKDKYSLGLALLNRGRLRVDMNDPDSAITDLSFSIDIIPDIADSWYLRAFSWFSKGEFLKAKEDLLRALEINPNNGKIFYLLGMTEISLNNQPLACEYLHQSALLSHIDGNKMYFFHCSDPVTKNKMFYSNGNFKFRYSQEINENYDTLFYLCNYDSSGNITQKGMIDLQTKRYNGVFSWYFPNGKIMKTGFVKDTVSYGLWKLFYNDGTIKEEYTVSNGLMTGKYKLYYPDGTTQTERLYSDGKLKNVFFCRDKNGNPMKFGSFDGGNGTLRIFDENGKIIHENLYKDGVITP